jgi:hypothetical protein
VSRSPCGHKGNIDTEARFENTYFFSVSVRKLKKCSIRSEAGRLAARRNLGTEHISFSVSVQRGNDALTGPPILPFHSVLYVPAWCACIQKLSLAIQRGSGHIVFLLHNNVLFHMHETSIIGAHTFVFGEICELVGGLQNSPVRCFIGCSGPTYFRAFNNMDFNIRGGHSPISVGVPSLWTLHNGVQFQSIHGIRIQSIKSCTKLCAECLYFTRSCT